MYTASEPAARSLLSGENVMTAECANRFDVLTSFPVPASQMRTYSATGVEWSGAFSCTRAATQRRSGESMEYFVHSLGCAGADESFAGSGHALRSLPVSKANARSPSNGSYVTITFPSAEQDTECPP